jgi:hypothetical protein
MVSYATQPELFQHNPCAGFVNGVIPKDCGKELSHNTTAVRQKEKAVKLPPPSTGLRQAADALEEAWDAIFTKLGGYESSGFSSTRTGF